jgi:FKBP-type peptidyl-prolyl cis-trans isomerase
MLNLLLPKKNAEQQEKAQKQNYNNPTWLRWVVFVFMLYAAYTVYTQDPSILQIKPNQLANAQQSTTPAATTQPFQNPSADNASNANILGQNIPLHAAPDGMGTNYRMGGEIQGNGDRAECGQLATAKADATNQDGTPFTELALDPTKDTTVTIGSMTGWVNGLRGMRVGGVREVFIPLKDVMTAQTISDKKLNPESIIRFKLQLGKLEPSSPLGSLGFQMVDLLPGQGNVALCGDKATVHVDVWGSDGKRIFSTKTTKDATPISFNVGSVPYFYGLDRAVAEQHVGGARRIIVTPEYLAAPPTNPAPTSETIKALMAAIGKDKTIIMDVYLISVENTQK